MTNKLPKSPIYLLFLDEDPASPGLLAASVVVRHDNVFIGNLCGPRNLVDAFVKRLMQRELRDTNNFFFQEGHSDQSAVEVRGAVAVEVGLGVCSQDITIVQTLLLEYTEQKPHVRRPLAGCA